MIEHIMYSIMLKTVCKAPKILKLKKKNCQQGETYQFYQFEGCLAIPN